MKTQMTVLALAATTLAVLAGCKPGVSTASAPSSADAQPIETVAASAGRVTPSSTPSGRSAPSPSASVSTAPTRSNSRPATRKPSAGPSWSSASGPKIVSFKLVQKPKCPEGTAVFRAPAVPAIIKWKVTGATGAALSVDDPTNTPGTYGPEPLAGTETFAFACNGPVGSTEKHTYAIWTVGGDGKQRSKTIVATAKVLDDGKN
jgi:hypothetical protein